ncbi:MAG: DedA family protein [Saprospiraceae bacterium]|nr:DedA family protein [Saprospiraceae bacterium]MBK8451450.1 DedA family protein [Saprospiraceae bacterium]MBK8483403.1 DedA family protein [Saprospiraceae bacterium]MBK9220914.1 DedA family protein [Saprospiraceae bacterium]MBK9722241.1 DedA family protein [Saprospiraceae bacterium]
MDWINQIIDFILHIDSHLIELVENYGIYIYIILFLILFCETGLVIAPFLPGDSLLFAAGALATSGNMNLTLLCFICLLGAILGNQLNFTIGKYFGPKIFEKDRKYIKKEYLHKTQAFYNKHGGKALIIGRYLPFIRTFVPFVAGIGQMDSYKFTFYNFLGAFLWIIPVVGIGYLFGNIPAVKENFSIVILGILIVSILPMIIGVFSAWSHSSKSK